MNDWDCSQKRVIAAPAAARIIVDAGPGTGKTAVACARLAHLISECGVEPSKAWMISFTRTAVAEIRARLHGYLGDDATAVRIATVDSHAWTIHSGFDENATLTGSYEANIEKVLDLVCSQEEVTEYLESVEHLILDEAQDFIGIRADLVEALLLRLSKNCGVTVFADEAQSIYGFSEEDTSTVDFSTDLLKRLWENPSLAFKGELLDTVHRTESQGLLEIFSDVRKTIL